MSKSTLLLCCSVAVLLAAGGGGIDTEVPPPATSHAVATRASPTSIDPAAYRTELSTALPEDQEPVDVGKFRPQQPEDTEPETVL